MTTWIMFDNDISPAAVQRRLREEMARRGISSDAQAAKRYGKHPQQWVSRHMNGQTDWKLQELQDFCDVLDLDYRYVTIGIRTINPPTNGGNVSWLPRMDSNHQPSDHQSLTVLPRQLTAQHVRRVA